MRRAGTILVAVLVVLAMASMVAASLLFRIRADSAAASAAYSRQQAYIVAQTGIQRALDVLTASANDPVTWRDDPELFRDQLVIEEGGQQWYFTIYAPSPEDPTTVRYGLIDEAGKINLITADEQTLSGLPGLTSDLVASLLDYRDTDDEERPEGAEQDYYSRLPTPYLIKNGPLATLEELLLVKGFNGSIVYGEDYNLNGLLEKNEDDGDDSFPPDNRDGVLNTGLMGLATVWSYERNVDSAGRPRININGSTDELNRLGSAGLPAATVDFIKRYRADGNLFRHPADLLNMEYQPQQPSGTGGQAGQAGQGAQGGPSGRGGRGGQGGGQGGQGGNQPQAILRSGVNAGNLSAVLDRLTTVPGGSQVPLMGLVNVNTAPVEVLSQIGGLDENLARQIVDARDALEGSPPPTIAWLVSQNVLGADAFKQVAPYLTARSLQFRVRCVGFAVPSGRFCVLEAVIDMAQGAPRVTYARELTHLGMPVPVDTEQLRSE